MSVKDKKFYWLKLKRDFFKRHDIKIIESRPNGEKYVLFYLKLLVESIDHEGSLRFNETIPYNDEMLATITNTDIDVVRTSVKLFRDLGMMEILDNGTLYMQEIQKMIGHETYWAKKKREERDKKKLENVQPSPICPSKSIEKELDKDKELELELDIEKDNKEKEMNEVCFQVIEYFNEVLGRRAFQPRANKNQKVIKARIREGWGLEDFKRVINYKYWHWSEDDRMSQYLRPETLFSNKFEGYLNASYLEEDKQFKKQQQMQESLAFLEEDYSKYD